MRDKLLHKIMAEKINNNSEFVACSLFDGMSCLQLALNKVGKVPSKYFASEIEKYPIQVTMANFPNTIQLGDVRNVKGSDIGFVDLLGGGSPCQSFSFAGKRKGMSTTDNIEILTLEHYLDLKSQNFEFEGQSYLFWEYVRILKELREINPDIKFLLENVMMGKKWQKILTRAIGINPIMINSALVSAQNRKRLYWTNIGAEMDGLFGDLYCKIPQPKDKGILLKDILETFETSNFETQDEFDNYMDKYFLSEKALNGLIKQTEKHKEKGNGFVFNPSDGNKKGNTNTNPSKNRVDDNYIVHNTMPISSKTGKGGTGSLSRSDGKTYCLDTGNTNAIEIQCVAMRGRNPENPKSRIAGLPTEQQLEPRFDGKTNCLTSVQKDNLVIQINPSKESGGVQPFQQNRIYDTDGLSPALMAQMSCGSHAIEIKSGTLRTHNDGKGFREVISGKGATIPARAREDGSGQNIVSISGNIRRLTPIECERLQTVPDNYTNHVSDTQRYKMLGNGWTIDVIVHILSYLNNKKQLIN